MPKPIHETLIPLANGCKVAAPSYPSPCFYVRLIDTEGEEIAYWDIEEFKDDAELVLGAFIGAMRDPDTEIEGE